MLKEQGFDDIENEKGKLRSTEFHKSRTKNFQISELMEITRDYFRWAEEMLHQGVFESDKERRVWECHANGLSSREIEKELSINFMTVHRIVTSTRTKLMKGMVIYEREEAYALEQRGR